MIENHYKLFKKVVKIVVENENVKKDQKSAYIDKESVQGGGRRLEGCLGGAWSVLGVCLRCGPEG